MGRSWPTIKHQSLFVDSRIQLTRLQTHPKSLPAISWALGFHLNFATNSITTRLLPSFCPACSLSTLGLATTCPSRPTMINSNQGLPGQHTYQTPSCGIHAKSRRIIAGGRVSARRWGNNSEASEKCQRVEAASL